MNKPWDNESTPLTDAAWTVDDNHDPFENDVARIATSLYIERRMRAAERLLDDEEKKTATLDQKDDEGNHAMVYLENTSIDHFYGCNRISEFFE